MTNNLKIKSGISKEELSSLNTYLKYIETNSIKSSRVLNEVLDECPRQLYEPVNIREKKEEQILDLAFIYHKDKIIGHIIQVFKKMKTDFGYRFSRILKESFSLEEIPDYLFTNYIEARMLGALETKVFDYEEKNTKQI